MIAETLKRLAAVGMSPARGTFTPSIKFGGANTGVTYASASGRWSRIGSLVHVDLAFTLSAVGSATGAATIEGLPFACAAASSGAAVNVAQYSGMASVAGMIHGLVAPGRSNIELFDRAATASQVLDNTNFGNSAAIVISVAYEI